MRGFRPDYDPDVLGLEQIKGALKIYRRRASQVAPVLLKRQLPIAVDFRISTHLGGTYHGDHIVIGGNATDPKDRVRTLAHEMGHYIFERVLSRDATEFWAKLISGDYGELDIREVVSKWPEHQLASEYVKHLATQDPILAIQLDTVRQGYSSLSRYPIGRGDFQRLVDEGTYKVSVPKNPITGYAGKSPEEAFCETLGMLVAYGPGAVLPQIRHWLKVIMPGEIKVSQNIAERIARRYVAFTGEITVKDIDRWKKDLRRMTKIYRSIKPVDSYNDPEGYRRAQEVAKEAKALWRTFTERFETWGYRVLLPRVKKEDRESSFEANIRSAVSDAAYRTWPSELFPEVRSRDGSFQKDPDIDLSELKSRRNRRVKSYQRAFVKLFSWVESYINSVGGGALKRRAPIETYQAPGGMTVVLDTHGMQEEGEAGYEYAKESLEKFIRGIDAIGVKPIQRAGFGKALKGLTLHVSFDRSDLVAGMYSATDDVLTIYPLGLGRDAKTFVHEVGHRFYYRDLQPNARKHWEETIEGRVAAIEAGDVRDYVDTFLRPKKWPPTSRELAVEIQRADLDPVTEAKYLKLTSMGMITPDTNEVQSRLMDMFVGERVQLDEITAYGTTNPTEAFAEAFTLWVKEGPSSVTPWTQNFFRVITRSGGAKLAERVARRFLAKLSDAPKAKRSKCMSCSAKPTVAYRWADGRGIAWFCDKHSKAWKSKEERDIVRTIKIEDGVMPTKIARAIRLDKRRIKELAKELEAVLARKSWPGDSLGNRMVVPSAPYDVRTVDGSTLTVYVRVQAQETASPYYVIDGGYGLSRRDKLPFVVVNVNGSMPAEQLRQAAKARQVQNQLYPVLLHEMTHAADKYTKGVGSRMNIEEVKGNLNTYYNDPTEVRAYMQEVVDEIEGRNWATFQSTFGPGKGMEYLLKTSPTWQEVSPHWTERNKRLVIKAVVQALDEA